MSTRCRCLQRVAATAAATGLKPVAATRLKTQDTLLVSRATRCGDGSATIAACEVLGALRQLSPQQLQKRLYRVNRPFEHSKKYKKRDYLIDGDKIIIRRLPELFGGIVGRQSGRHRVSLLLYRLSHKHMMTHTHRDVNKAGSFKAKAKAKARSLKAKTNAKARDEVTYHARAD